jgi:hypothetical protein
MNPKTKNAEPEREDFWKVIGRNDCVLSVSISSGFANISMQKDYTGNYAMVVKFFDEEGNCNEDMDIPAKDVLKVGIMLEDIKKLRLNDYTKEVTK